jgi:hypothetical protein
MRSLAGLDSDNTPPHWAAKLTSVASRPGPSARLRTSQPPSPPGFRATDRAICPQRRGTPRSVEPSKAGANAGRRFAAGSRGQTREAKAGEAEGVCGEVCSQQNRGSRDANYRVREGGAGSLAGASRPLTRAGSVRIAAGGRRRRSGRRVPAAGARRSDQFPAA